jgi:hypothetical protein
MTYANYIALATTFGIVAAAGACSAPPAHPFTLTNPVLASARAEQTDLGRAELWAAHCTRCHALRPRQEYNPAQWAVVVNHMRTIADLSGEDYRRLLEYLADRTPAPAGTDGKAAAGNLAGETTRTRRSP